MTYLGLFIFLSINTLLKCEECKLTINSLVEAEQLVLENNKDIRVMRELLEKGKQGRLESISKWLPEINLISRGYKTEREESATDSRSAFVTQFGLTQTIFSANRYYNVRISSLEVEQLRLLLDALIIDVLFDLRTSYYQIILDHENIATAKKNVELFTKLAEQMESNYEIGTSILLNVNQSKVAIANATSVYYEAVKQLQIDLNRLVTLLGYNPGSVELEFNERMIPIESIPEIASKVNRVEEIFEEQNGVIYKHGFPETEKNLMKNLFSESEVCCWESQAINYRPDLRSKFTNWKIADQEIRKSQGEYLPYVFFEANYGGYPTRLLDNPSSSYFNQKYDWAVGFNIEWLLFDSWGRKYRINQARYERNAKCLEYAKEIQITYEEVRNQIFDIEESVASYVTAQGNVNLAEETLDLANKQLEIGYITVFDYQIVVNSLIQALNIRNQARFDLIKGYYGLRHASGVDLICR